MRERKDDHWVYYMAQIGHELRTPLNIIKGFGEMLESESPGSLNDQQKLYLDKILSGADDLTVIIDDILEWARISSNQLVLDRESFSVRETLLELADFFRLGFEKAGLEVHYDLQEIPKIYGDPQRIKQALINVIGNAMKYVPPGREVRIACRERGSVIDLLVEDNGPGLSDEDLVRIMEPFRRGSQSMKTKQGTGLGLWITQAILEAHGGRLMASNAAKGGAIFVMTLPVEED